ncbi:solute carrier family 22 member 4-like [Leguminivora glycinivorella]|uniref:solute carrier family 22 member 4-like n=1 Tax=Leguminivora glycinivorella TaxID=1035111 RepID=UPI00200E5B00|nr:solute carrier family 22 member 4-like [Leguminivora glycinivorella]
MGLIVTAPCSSLVSTPRIGSIHEDVTTDVLGQIGAWQWMVTIVSTTLMASNMFNQYEDMFLLKQSTNIVCTLPQGFNANNYSQCHVIAKNNSEEIRCQLWHVKVLGLFWLKKNWIMACDQDWKFLSAAMICRLGVMFGYVVFGLISDSFGRKKAMVLDVYTNLVLRISIIVCDSESWFRLLVFIRSLLGSANNFMGLILICEIASNKWRSWLSMIVATPRLLAAVCMVPLARALSNSESFTFIACLYDLLLIVILRWTPESPQWLLFNNKITKAEKTIFKGAKQNHVSLCSDFKIRPVNQRAYVCLDEDQTCIPILSTHNTRVLTFVSLIFWSLNCFSWSIIYSTNYSGEQTNYYLLKILCLVAIIGCLTVVLSLKCSLRHLLMIHIFLAGVSGLAALTCKEVGEPICSILYPFALATSLNAHAITLSITPRLFAIKIRATLLGCCHAAGQMGAIIGYLITSLKLVDEITLALLEAAATVAMLVLCLVFPDVDDREMPDVLEDMDYFSELSKPLRWATQKTHSPSREEIELRNLSFGSTRARVASSTTSEHAPARPIGCATLWRAIYRLFCRNK